MKILIIEDSPLVVEAISAALERRWPDLDIVSTGFGEQGIQITDSQSPDVVLLDLGLPDINGFEVLRRIRLFSTVPIVILTANSEESNVVKGLENGADDYVVKSFLQMDLLARIQEIIQRSKLPDQALVHGQLRLYPVSLRLTVRYQEILISCTESIILGQLMRNAVDAVSYSSLREAIRGTDFPEASNSVKPY